MPKKRSERIRSITQHTGDVASEELVSGMSSNGSYQELMEENPNQNNRDSLGKQVQNLQKTVEQLTKLVQETNKAMASMQKNKQQLPKAHKGGLVQEPQTESTSAEADMSDQVDQQLQDHLQFVMAEPEEGADQHFNSCCIPLDVNVSDKVKSQIWADQYVDFAKLNEPDVPGEFNLSLVPGGSGGQIKLTPSKNVTTISTVGQWAKAFHVFMSVYSERYPDQTKHLLTYEHKIRHLAVIGGDWQRYDLQFRKLRAKNPIHWGKSQVELWLECTRQQPKQFQPFRQAGRAKGPMPFRQGQAAGYRPFRGPTPRHPQGSCFEFHDVGRCSKRACPFSHACYKAGCTGNHPVFHCKLGANRAPGGVQRANNPNTSPNAPSHPNGRGQGQVRK
jgi:hypothetical protein